MKNNLIEIPSYITEAGILTIYSENKNVTVLRQISEQEYLDALEIAENIFKCTKNAIYKPSLLVSKVMF